MKENENRNRNKRRIGIVVSVLILGALAAVWAVKNAQKGNETESGNPDFALSANAAPDLEKLESYGLPILIEFGSDGCAPCRQMAPIIEELNTELQGKAIVKFVDVWAHPDFADGYPLSVIPTQLFIDSEGKPYSPSDPDASGMNLYTSKETGEPAFTTHEGLISKDELVSILTEMGMK